MENEPDDPYAHPDILYPKWEPEKHDRHAVTWHDRETHEPVFVSWEGRWSHPDYPNEGSRQVHHWRWHPYQKETLGVADKPDQMSFQEPEDVDHYELKRDLNWTLIHARRRGRR